MKAVWFLFTISSGLLLVCSHPCWPEALSAGEASFSELESEFAASALTPSNEPLNLSLLEEFNLDGNPLLQEPCGGGCPDFSMGEWDLRNDEAGFYGVSDDTLAYIKGVQGENFSSVLLQSPKLFSTEDDSFPVMRRGSVINYPMAGDLKLALSNNGSYLFTASPAGTVARIDLKSGKMLSTNKRKELVYKSISLGIDSVIKKISLTPNERFLILGGDGWFITLNADDLEYASSHGLMLSKSYRSGDSRVYFNAPTWNSYGGLADFVVGQKRLYALSYGSCNLFIYRVDAGSGRITRNIYDELPLLSNCTLNSDSARLLAIHSLESKEFVAAVAGSTSEPSYHMSIYKTRPEWKYSNLKLLSEMEIDEVDGVHFFNGASLLGFSRSKGLVGFFQKDLGLTSKKHRYDRLEKVVLLEGTNHHGVLMGVSRDKIFIESDSSDYTGIQGYNLVGNNYDGSRLIKDDVRLTTQDAWRTPNAADLRNLGDMAVSEKGDVLVVKSATGVIVMSQPSKSGAANSAEEEGFPID